jgi:Beta-propeller repeat
MPSATNKPRIAAMFENLPLIFETNRGQATKQVKFLARGDGYDLFLTGDGATLALRTGAPAEEAPLPIGDGSEKTAREEVLRIRPIGANPRARIEGVDKLPGKANYFTGNDPKKWHTDISMYARVRYRDVYPGIDLVFYGSGGARGNGSVGNAARRLEYDFILRPGANPEVIRLRFEGATKLALNHNGDVIARLAGGGKAIQQIPAIYQVRDGRRGRVAGGAILRDKSTIGFSLAEYDRARPVYIDPGLVYSTYLGGEVPNRGGVVGDYAEGIAVDSAGDIYVAGTTFSPDFPTNNAFQSTCGACANGDSSAFVAKLDPAASGAASLLYSTYLGGNGVNGTVNFGGDYGDQGNGIAVDSAGDVYVTGETRSTDFPVTANAFQSALKGIGNDAVNAFVAKLDPAASGAAQLLYSTYLGGSGNVYFNSLDGGNGIAVDSAGDAYVTGFPDSTDFPITPNAFQSTCSSAGNGCHGAFVAKLDPSASGAASLLYSTYLSGNDSEQNDEGDGIAVDSSGNAYVTGVTGSADFPTTPNAFESTCGLCGTGEVYVFVAKLNPAASGNASLLYSTFLGGGAAGGIAVDSSGDAYVTGTATDGFPVTAKAFQKKLDGTDDAFVAKLDPAASGKASLLYSTLLGGRGDEGGTSITVDSVGDAYITGSTISVDFPVTSDAFQTTPKGFENAFVAELNPAASGKASLLYSSYLGGTSIVNQGTGIAVDSSGNAYVTGNTEAPDFPTTPNAFQSSPAEIATAFVTEINLGASGPTELIVTPKERAFGKTKVGTTTSKAFEVRANAGKKSGVTAVLLDNFSVQSTNGTGMWAIDPLTTCEQPNALIPVGETCKVVVDYTPTQATAENQFDTATLAIATNAETVSPAGGIMQLKGGGKAP